MAGRGGGCRLPPRSCRARAMASKPKLYQVGSRLLALEAALPTLEIYSNCIAIDSNYITIYITFVICYVFVIDFN